MGTDTIGPTPTLIPGGVGPFTHLAVGAAHACVLDASGTALCVGSDADEQLGNGAATSTASLMPVVGGLRFTSITAGARHTCALATDGDGYCWGSNVYGALGNELQAAFRGAPNKIARVR
jgi:alpha-tubulin suppressor-like RCC1 family protein